jgi:acyl carrier protein
MRLSAQDLARVDAAAPLFGDALGLDSLDSMALVVALEERFGVTLQNDATTRKAFSTIGSLSKYLAALRSGRPPS